MVTGNLCYSIESVTCDAPLALDYDHEVGGEQLCIDQVLPRKTTVGELRDWLKKQRFIPQDLCELYKQTIIVI